MASVSSVTPFPTARKRTASVGLLASAQPVRTFSQSFGTGQFKVGSMSAAPGGEGGGGGAGGGAGAGFGDGGAGGGTGFGGGG